MTAYSVIAAPGVTGGRFCALLDEANLVRARTTSSWDLHAGGGGPGMVGFGSGDYAYQTVGEDGIVPLVHHRVFHDGSPDVIELAEDFRLLWQLRVDGDEYWTTNGDGDRVVVARREDGALLVRRSYIRRYQAARQLAVAEYVEVTRSDDETLQNVKNHNIDIDEDGYILSYYTGQFSRLPFTRLLGKRITTAPAAEVYGEWPYEPEKRYVDFIIGADDAGRDVTHTCDPGKLANYFGANPDAPHYLTPVFFRREVLQKYYNDDRFKVQDGHIDAAYLWGLRVDNNTQDHVIVFLGDLGQDLPESEQMYWRSYNIQPDGSMSDTNIRRSFLGEFADPERVEFRFRTKYEEVNEAWDRRFGWRLYREPHESDQHIVDAMHVPITGGYQEFDDEIVPLAKLVVDSLNEKAIVGATAAPKKGEVGIQKLERLLEELDYPEREAFLKVLRLVQGARSRSGAHLKGSDFDELKLLGDAGSLPELFESYLEAFIAAFGALIAFCGSAPGSS